MTKQDKWTYQELKKMTADLFLNNVERIKYLKIILIIEKIKCITQLFVLLSFYNQPNFEDNQLLQPQQ